MTELALNILDIANNSTRADASVVTVRIAADTARDKLRIEIEDDGRGMDEALLQSVSDPFATTRTTRKVGMGVPLFKMAAELAGGGFAITSALGKGTKVRAEFQIGHIDRAPLGDVAGTVATLIGGAANTDFALDYTVDGRQYLFSTREVKQALGENDLTDPFITGYIADMIRENIEKVNGGIQL